MRALLAAVAALLLLAQPARGACAGAETPIASATTGSASSAVRCLVNSARVARGRRPLNVDARLRSAARQHARDMVRLRYFAHTSPDGGGPVARAVRRGFGAGVRWVGENLAWATGRATPRRVVGWWLESPSHRATMLDGRFRVMGVAAATGTPHDGPGGGSTFATVFGG